MADNVIEKIEKANKKVVDALINANPVLVDIKPAIEVAKGMTKNMILHAGPPADWDNLSIPQQNGILNGIIYEGLAHDKDSALELVKNGGVKIESALDHNVVGAGVGLVTASINLFVVQETNTGAIGCTFPAEGEMGGGYCGWGLNNEEIAANFKYLNNKVFPYLVKVIKKKGGINLKPILAQSLQMGDENHTRQVAADGILLKQIISDIVRLDADRGTLINVVDYVSKTERLFHGLGQSGSMASILSIGNVDYSTIVTAMAGNGVEFGIKTSCTENEWFTSKAPYIRGRFISRTYSDDEIVPWMGDSCIVEVNGLGGFSVAASPIVMNLRGGKLKDAIAQTDEMRKICYSENKFFAIPNIDYTYPPIGIDIRKVLETGIMPAIHGGIFGKGGRLVGAGIARAPLECFEKAIKRYAQKYDLQ